MATTKQISHAKSMSLDDIDRKIFPDYDRFISPEISRRKATFNAQRKRGRLDGKSEAALRILIRLTRIEICKLYVSDHEQYKILMSPQYNALPVEINMVEMAKIMNPDLNTPQYKWDSREVLAKSKSSYDFFGVLENPDLAFFIEPYSNYKQPQPRTITRTRLGITQTFTQRDPVYKENSSRVKDENGFTVLRPFGRGNIRYWISKEWLLGIAPHAATDNNGVTGTPDTPFLGTTVGNSYQSDSEKNLNGLRPNLNSFSEKRKSGVFSTEKTIFKAAIAEKEIQKELETEVKNKRNIAPAPPPETPERRKETFEHPRPSNIVPPQRAKNLFEPLRSSQQTAKNLPESLRSGQQLTENLTIALQNAQDLDAYALRLWQRVKDLHERYWLNGQVRYNTATPLQWRLPDYIQDETEYDDLGKKLCVDLLQHDQRHSEKTLANAYSRLCEAVKADNKWLETPDKFILHLNAYLSLEKLDNNQWKYKNGCLRFRLEKLYPLSTQKSHTEDATTGNILATYAHKLGKFGMNVHESETWLQKWIDQYIEYDTEDLKTLRHWLNIGLQKYKLLKSMSQRLKSVLTEISSPEYHNKMERQAEKQQQEAVQNSQKQRQAQERALEKQRQFNEKRAITWRIWQKWQGSEPEAAKDFMLRCLLVINQDVIQNLGYDNILKFEEITTPLSISPDILKGSIADKREYYRLRLWHTKVMSGLEQLFPNDFNNLSNG